MQMNQSLMSVLVTAVCRGVALVFLGIAGCALVLGAVGFALVAVFNLLDEPLGSALAAFATSGIAIAIPAVASLIITLVTRTSELDGMVAPDRPLAAATARAAQARAAARAVPATANGAEMDRALDWISRNPKTATLSALSVGVALGAYPDLRKTVLDSVGSALTPQPQRRPETAH
jgi:hypothetical protein